MTAPRPLVSAELRVVLVFCGWILAIAAMVNSVVYVVSEGILGIDFIPLRHAAESLLDWRTVYSDRTFVYPPTSTPLLLPLAAGSEVQVFVAWTIAGALAQVAAAVILVRSAGRPIWSAVVPLLMIVNGQVFNTVLSLGNLSVMMVPVAAVIVVAFHKQRWQLGCAVLAASLLIKPLLLALILVPLAHRRYRECLRAFVPAGALLIAAMLVLPGGTRVDRFVGYVLSGTNLHGHYAMLNLSIAGWAETHHVATPTATFARVVVVALCAAVAVRAARRRDPAATVQLSLLACLALLLCGRLTENHFLLIVIVIAVARLVLTPSTRAVAIYAPGLLVFYLPAYVMPDAVRGPANGTLLIAGELLLLAATVTDICLPRHSPHRSAQRVTPPAVTGVELPA